MMTSGRRTHQARLAATAIAVLAALAALPVASNADPSLDQLNSELGQQQQRQQSLSSGVARLSQMISSLDGQITLVESREVAVRGELVQDRAKLAAAQAALDRERQLLAVLRARLARARTLLSRQLVSSYEGDRPDLVSVVLESRGFADLLDKITYLRDAERQQQGVIAITRLAKARADAAARRLGALEERDRQIAEDTAVRARALAGMNSLLHSKQGALLQARAAKQSALDASRAKAGALQSKISQIEAQQAAAAQQAAQQSASQGSSSPSGSSSASVGPALGPSGGWAIPYPIVLCESGGQNLPPNSAGASGYYQIMPATWASFGGTGPAAYLASKSEQDAVASRIWNGGAGASNWVCAGIVGIH
jgi:septal ring factor EnvC (AmiA/AmiB activator)